VKGRSAESTYLIESVGAFVVPTFSYADSIALPSFCADSIARKLLFTLQVSCFPAICGVTENPRHFVFPLSFLKSENTKWCGVEAVEEDKAHWAICLDRQRLLSQSL
jgi:hypothetical protein